MLWAAGGYRVVICGNTGVFERLASLYRRGGTQNFDVKTMSDVYENEFEILNRPYSEKPESKSSPKSVGGYVDGCRIGFDAGGSDRKVSAVIDGETVFSEEVVWFPKVTEDPQYHYDGIVAAFKSAAEHKQREDAVGISSAVIFINNRTMSASLFLCVPKDLYESIVKDIYIRAVEVHAAAEVEGLAFCAVHFERSVGVERASVIASASAEFVKRKAAAVDG